VGVLGILDCHAGQRRDPLNFLQSLVESGPKDGPDYEAQQVYGRADHRDFEGAGGLEFRAELCRKYGMRDASF